MSFKVENINSTNIDYEKYREDKWVKPLKLTDSELKKHIKRIVEMVQEREKCENDLSGECNHQFHDRLIRKANNELTWVAIECEKYQKINKSNLKKQYVLYSFPDKKLELRLTPEFVGNKGDFTIGELLKKYKEFLREKDLTHGVYIYGEPGIGKTYITICLANELAIKGKKIIFLDAHDFTRRLKENDFANSEELINECKHVEVLFLDDLGAENEKDWYINSVLMPILNFRMEHEKATFFTSNLSIEKLAKAYDNINGWSKSDLFYTKRLIDRIRALTKNRVYEIKGKNRRYD